MFTRVTQKSYMVPTSGPQALSSRSYTSRPSARISSLSFSWVCSSSSFWSGLGTCMVLDGGYGGASEGAVPGAAEQDAGDQVEPPAVAEAARSNMDNIFGSHIDNLWQQLDTLAQEKLGNMPGLVQYKEMANGSRDEAEGMHQIKYEELQTLAGKQENDLHCTKTKISKMNWNINQLQAETEGLKG
ncbi:Keratin, type II cytoskeletal 8 [Plecturocebus cupreus]